MGPILIVEGKSDRKFLKDFIKYHFQIELSRDRFIEANGNSLKPVRPLVKANNVKGVDQLVVFDADKSVAGTRARIVAESKELEIAYSSHFFFPNNKASGNLETLLFNIINPDRKDIFECIDNYQKCVEPLFIEEMKPFSEKSKVFVYIDSFTVGGQGKEEKRDYTETLLWDLKSDYLNPLREFLAPYFT